MKKKKWFLIMLFHVWIDENNIAIAFFLYVRCNFTLGFSTIRNSNVRVIAMPRRLRHWPADLWCHSFLLSHLLLISPIVIFSLILFKAIQDSVACINIRVIVINSYFASVLLVLFSVFKHFHFWWETW